MTNFVVAYDRADGELISARPHATECAALMSKMTFELALRPGMDVSVAAVVACTTRGAPLRAPGPGFRIAGRAPSVLARVAAIAA